MGADGSVTGAGRAGCPRPGASAHLLRRSSGPLYPLKTLPRSHRRRTVRRGRRRQSNPRSGRPVLPFP